MAYLIMHETTYNYLLNNLDFASQIQRTYYDGKHPATTRRTWFKSNRRSSVIFSKLI